MLIKEIDIDIDYTLMLDEYNKLDIDQKLVEADHLKQIAIQARSECAIENQLYESTGSLYYDWVNYDGNGDVPLRTDMLVETKINQTCDYFKNTYFDTIIEKIKNAGYNVYRGRFMKSIYKTCLTMHKDPSPRLHIPIYTNDDCFMVIKDKVFRLPFGKTYIVDTRQPHTAINASKNNRVHLVFCIDKF